MLASVSAVLGILLGLIVSALVRRRETTRTGASAEPTSLDWYVLALGLLAVPALLAGLLLSPRPNNTGLPFYLLSEVLGFAAVVAGIGGLRRGERGWPTWVGLLAGLVPSLFWIAFAAGHLVGPGD